MNDPYLSITIAGRNDNHLSGFTDRLQMSINILSYLSAKHGLDVELIITEWNPPINMLRLRDVLIVPQYLKSKITIVTVSKELHDTIPSTMFDAIQPEDLDFYLGIAQNVAIKHAKGLFVLSTNADIIINEKLIKFFSMKKLEARFFYRICRFDVQKTIPEQFNYNDTLHFCEKNSIPRGLPLNKEILYKKAAGDFILATNKVFRLVRGYPEIRCDGYRIDGEILDILLSACTQNLFMEPFCIYHQFHPPRHLNGKENKNTIRKFGKTYRQSIRINDRTVLMISHSVANLNDKNWGLGLHNLEMEVL